MKSAGPAPHDPAVHSYSECPCRDSCFTKPREFTAATALAAGTSGGLGGVLNYGGQKNCGGDRAVSNDWRAPTRAQRCPMGEGEGSASSPARPAIPAWGPHVRQRGHVAAQNRRTLA